MFHMLELNSIRDHFDQGHSNYHDLVMFTLKYCKVVLSYFDGAYSGVGIKSKLLGSKSFHSYYLLTGWVRT